ncbi:MAG: hypothetical protein QOH46_2859 [Solirubrobacteraceae bacterium]|jgi:hypothetical protein|nr:hypothetical protein [Solirubrobacteraceae bacterium]
MQTRLPDAVRAALATIAGGPRDVVHTVRRGALESLLVVVESP